MRLIAPLFLAAALAASAPAIAAPQEIASQAVSQEAQDRAIVQKVMGSGSLTAARAYQADLKAVLDRAPDSYPLIERTANRVLIRATGSQTALMASLTAAVEHEKSGDKGKLDVFNEFNTYGMAAFLLGSLAVEARDPAGALPCLDRGLALQPDNLMLVTEKGIALVMMKRFGDALALYEATETVDSLAIAVDPQGKARLLRAKGFALIELHRLKEAEAAYVQSLKLEPDHAGAKGELEYIRKLNKGAAPTEIQIKTGDKAKFGDKAPPKP